MCMQDDDVLTILEGGNHRTHRPADSRSCEKKKEKPVNGGYECALPGALGRQMITTAHRMNHRARVGRAFVVV